MGFLEITSNVWGSIVRDSSSMLFASVNTLDECVYLNQSGCFI